MINEASERRAEFITVAEASTILGISPDTIRRWEKKGLIKAKRDGFNYRRFSLTELERAKGKYLGDALGEKYVVLKSASKTNISTVEIFTGSGGLALGLEHAGLRNKLLVEIEPDCAKTLKANRPKWNVISDDIRNVDFTEFKGKIDIVAGGFPCQAFSYAGKSRGFADTRGTLFFEFARCLKEIQPKIAVAENVRGLITHDNGRTLATIRNSLEEIGYRNKYRMLRAQFLDVPQKRERLFIIAIHEDYKFDFIFPKEKDYTINLREALKGCKQSGGYTYSPNKHSIMELIPHGGNWRDLTDELRKKYMGASYFLGGGKTGMARRLSWDEPSLTLTCNPAQKQTERCHPEETRPLSIREYARIQTFPDEWEFVGSVASQYRQIGNAVPVNLAFHVGRCLIAMLTGKMIPGEMEIYEEEPKAASQLALF